MVRVALQRVAELNRHILQQIATASAEGIVVVDASSLDYRVTYVNPAYEEMTGYSAEAAVGNRWRLLDSSGEDSCEIAALRAAFGNSERYQAMVPDVREDGTSWLSRVRVYPIFNRRGELKQFLIMQNEAAEFTERHSGLQVGLLQRELKRARQKAANLDHIDMASGLLRYEYFLELADRDYRVARRTEEVVAVALFEINDLDVYRQTFGAKASDSCLRMIGAQVTGALRRAGDLCGCDDGKRIVAFTRGDDAERVSEVAKRIAENVRQLGLHNPRGRSGRYVTVSTAVATCTPSADRTLTDLIDEARGQLQGASSASAQQRASRA